MTDSDDPGPLLPFRSTQHDLFISFSVKDRDFVKKLHAILAFKFKLITWYSGEKLKGTCPSLLLYDINQAIRNTKFCIAVFSKNTIYSKWFYSEIGAFFAQETLEKRMIIPVLHGINYEEFVKYFPLFADRFALVDDENLDEIARQVVKFVEGKQSILKHKAFQPIFCYPTLMKGGEPSENSEELFRFHANVIQLYDPTYTLSMLMENFFLTEKSLRSTGFTSNSTDIVEKMYDALIRRTIA